MPVKLREVEQIYGCNIQDIKSSLPNGFRGHFHNLVRRYSAINPNYSKNVMVAEVFQVANNRNPLNEMSEVSHQLELGAFAGHLAFLNSSDVVEISSGLGMPTIAASTKFGVDSYVVEPNLNCVVAMSEFLSKFGNLTRLTGRVKSFRNMGELQRYEDGFFGLRKINRSVVVADKPHAKLDNLIDYVQAHDSALFYHPCCCDKHKNPLESISTVSKKLDDSRFDMYILDKPLGYMRVWKN